MSGKSKTGHSAKNQNNIQQRSYQHALDDRFFLEVTMSSDRGRMTDFLVGLYLRRPKRMIARFDNRHTGGKFAGIVHLDLLDKNGDLRAKVPFANLELKDAIRYAQDYFKSNREALEAQIKFWG